MRPINFPRLNNGYAAVRCMQLVHCTVFIWQMAFNRKFQEATFSRERLNAATTVGGGARNH